MPDATPLQALPVPIATDDPDVVGDVTTLAKAIEKKLVQVYLSASDRNAKVTAPTEGMFCILKDTNIIQFHDGTNWIQIYPTSFPSITSGTNAPSNSSGANGDVFFKV